MDGFSLRAEKGMFLSVSSPSLCTHFPGYHPGNAISTHTQEGTIKLVSLDKIYLDLQAHGLTILNCWCLSAL